MSTPAVLAIDLGTGSVKALLIDRQCSVLASASASYPVDRPHDGWAEQSPDDWWNATVDAVRKAVAAAGDVSLDAMGLSGQMHGTVLLDSAGRPVRPAIIWEDRRSAKQVASLTERIGAAQLIDICGSPVATGFQAATLAWLVEHEPVSIARTSSVLLPADYLRFRLTGELATEPSDASSTLLFDIRRRDWSPVVREAVGIDVALLPPVVSSTSFAGALHPAAAEAMGLPEGIRVAGGGADAPLAALAAGAMSSDTLMLTISTGSQAILPADQPVVDPRGRIHTWCGLAEPGTELPGWYQMGATLASGRALRWFREELLAQPDSDLESIVASVPPGSDGLLFLPYLNGERTPHMDPEASGAFLGLKAQHGSAALTRAVMEGSVFALFDAYRGPAASSEARLSVSCWREAAPGAPHGPRSWPISSRCRSIPSKNRKDRPWVRRSSPGRLQDGSISSTVPNDPRDSVTASSQMQRRRQSTLSSIRSFSTPISRCETIFTRSEPLPRALVRHRSTLDALPV